MSNRNPSSDQQQSQQGSSSAQGDRTKPGLLS